MSGVPIPAPPGPPSGKKCVKWRQTGHCDPNGKREPQNDVDCNVTVDGYASGYCECENGRKAGAIGCHHQPFRCQDVCVPPPPMIPPTSSVCPPGRAPSMCTGTRA